MAFDISIKIGGAAGQGIMSFGHILGKCLQRNGLWVFLHSDYPSLIRGGHNTVQIRASEERVYSQKKHSHMLVALNRETITLHQEEIEKRGVILFDKKDEIPEDEMKAEGVTYIPLQIKELAKYHGGFIFENIIAMGAVLGILGIDPKIAESVIADEFAKKGEDVIKKDINALHAGYDAIKSKLSEFSMRAPRAKKPKGRIFLDGNLAITLGAIKSGMKFLAQYPMTPATSILTYTAKYEKDYGIVVKQVEDEIGVINMAIGAGFAGVRAMCATSGGGFSLMSEAVGLAANSETPVVIVQAQRAGTSTGLPTYTEQGDLRQVLHASQSDFSRVVVAPGDIEECFYDAFEAFNIAEYLQCPVIILTDKYLATSMRTEERFDTSDLEIERGKLLSQEKLLGMERYNRYEITEDGISPRSIPGQKNGLFVGTSYEHDETSFTSEDPEMYVRQKRKRMKKFDNIPKEFFEPFIYGDEKSETLIIVWGSTKMPALEAQKMLEDDGIGCKVMQVHYLYPFPSEEVKREIEKSKNVIIVEGNMTSLLGSLIREKTGIRIKNRYLKHDGRPFYPEEIAEAVKQMLAYGSFVKGYENPCEV